MGVIYIQLTTKETRVLAHVRPIYRNQEGNAARASTYWYIRIIGDYPILTPESTLSCLLTT